MASAFHNTVRFYVALFQSIAKRHSFSPILQVAFHVFKTIDNQLYILWQRAAVSFVPAEGLTHLCKARYDYDKEGGFFIHFLHF